MFAKGRGVIVQPPPPPLTPAVAAAAVRTVGMKYYRMQPSYQNYAQPPLSLPTHASFLRESTTNEVSTIFDPAFDLAEVAA